MTVLFLIAITHGIPEKPRNSYTNKTIKKTISNPLYGIDISHHQGNINWRKFKSNKNINFIYIKATEGASFIDNKTYENFYNAKLLKIPVGTYHYFKTTSTGEDQYRNYAAAVAQYKQDLIPMVDVEERGSISKDKFHKNLQVFLDSIKINFGKNPLIYTGNSFYNDYLRDKYKKYYFCIAKYNTNPPQLIDSSSWAIWQYTENGKLRGVSGHVDINLINPKFEFKNLKL